MQQTVLVTPSNKQNTQRTSTAALLIAATAGLFMSTNSSAQETWAIELGESPKCTACHTTQPGNGDSVKPAAQQAYDNGGVIPGLKDYLASLKPPTNAKPVILPIDTEWNAQIGETPLSIPLIIKDEKKSGFKMELTSALPTLLANTHSFSSLYLEAAQKRPTIDFKWTPSAKQKATKYTTNFRASEVTSTGATQYSGIVKTSIYLWPARAASAKNVVSQFTVTSAKWVAPKLTLSGRIVFKKTATAAAKTAALKALRLNLKSNAGTTVGSPVALSPNSSTGIWASSFTLNAAQVPCLAKAEYEKLIAARTVKLAPSTCKK